MSRDPEFRARDKKTHKMTRDGLVERNEATGQETSVSQRGQDFQLRPTEQPGVSHVTGSGTSRGTDQSRSRQSSAPRHESVPDNRAPDYKDDLPLRSDSPADRHSVIEENRTISTTKDMPIHHEQKQVRHQQSVGERSVPHDPRAADDGRPQQRRQYSKQQQPQPSSEVDVPNSLPQPMQSTNATAPKEGSGGAGSSDRPSRLRYDDAHGRDAGGAQPRQRGTKYHQQFTPESVKADTATATETPKAGTDEPKSSRLNFSSDELPPEPPGKKLTKARRKAERTGEKLEKAQSNLPTHKKARLNKEFDADKGKMKRRLHFETEVKSKSAHVKGPLPLRPVHAAKNSAIGYAHKKVYEVQHENVGTEAAHKIESVAEGGIRAGWRLHKTAPYRKVARLEKKSVKLNVRSAYQQALHDNPKLRSDAFSRMLQKRKIKKEYAAAAREAKRAGKAAKEAGTVIGRAGQAVGAFVKSHPAIFGIGAGILLLIMVIFGMFSSCSNMGTGSLGAIFASTYLAEDKDIDDAELYYTEWETDLLMKVESAEADHPGYDEYRYSVDDVGHDPYELMAFLTAAYQDFKYSEVQALLRQIFEEQYSLTFTPEVEIRTRTVTKYRSVYDPVSGEYMGEESYEDTEEYEWHIMNVNLTARSFTELVVPRMIADEMEIYNVLMQTYGNRQYIKNVFAFNWLPYVSSNYGYRVHPITGEKNFHKAVDIAVAQGTEILAGHDGVVTIASNDSSYGLYVAIEGTLPTGESIVTKYAHCSELLVSPGQQISAGDVIAKVGSTGQSTGPHLHLELIVDGQYLNPLYFAVTGDDGSGRIPPGSPGGVVIPDYPGEPMGDGTYAALMAEAQKHIGKPYVFGAKGPDKFDCSGFVCWSLTHSGIKSIATNAQGLYNACTPVSRENAQPGDLIFFHSTYSTPNTVTHVGIYIGNGMMLHAGKPIQYSSIDTNYWQNHFYAFGRIN